MEGFRSGGVYFFLKKSGRARARQGTEICNFGEYLPPDLIEVCPVFFSPLLSRFAAYVSKEIS